MGLGIRSTAMMCEDGYGAQRVIEAKQEAKAISFSPGNSASLFVYQNELCRVNLEWPHFYPPPAQ